MRHRYLFLAVFLLPAAFISVTGDVSRTLLAVQEDDCAFEDITPAIAAILCAVERKAWIISKSSSAVKNAGCLLGGDRCKAKRHVPTESEVEPSPPPPAAKNKQYQALAMAAEKVVPKTWWREAFADKQFLLSSNDKDLPRKQFDASRLRNKKLKNILQCTTRQQFIRKSFPFSKPQDDASKCTAMSEPVVKAFYELWQNGDTNVMFGGELIPRGKGHTWAPKKEGDGKLLVAAMEVLDYFYTNYGGIWTGCFKMDTSAPCRGALAGIINASIQDHASYPRTLPLCLSSLCSIKMIPSCPSLLHYCVKELILTSDCFP